MDPKSNTRLSSYSDIYAQAYALFMKTFGRAFLLVCSYLLFPVIIGIGLVIVLMHFAGPAGGILIVPLVVVFIYLSIRVRMAMVYLLYTNNHSLHYTEYWKMTKTRIWKFFCVDLGKKLIINGGMVLLVIPSIIFALRYMFALPIYLLDSENTGFRKSLAKSRATTMGYKWGILGRILALAFPIAIGVCLLWVASFSIGSSSLIAGVVLGVIATVATVVGFGMISCVTPVLYFQLKDDTEVNKLEKKWFVIIMIVLGLLFGGLTNIFQLAANSRLMSDGGVPQPGELNTEAEEYQNTAPELQQSAQEIVTN
jgi:hypothetical protein